MIYSRSVPSPLGALTIASDGYSIVGLWIGGQKHFGAGIREMVPGSLPLFDQTERWLDRYFSGENPDPGVLPLKPRGTPFQQAVWSELEKIPYGRTVTYGEVAKAMGCRSPQAVGGAVGRNPIAILIPCHRVVGKNGLLTGYTGGLDKKRLLLELEHPSA